MAFLLETVADNLTANTKCRVGVDYEGTRHIVYLDGGALMHAYTFYGGWQINEIYPSVIDFDCIVLPTYNSLRIACILANGELWYLDYSGGTYHWKGEIVSVAPLNIVRVAVGHDPVNTRPVVGFLVDNGNGTHDLRTIRYNIGTMSWDPPAVLENDFEGGGGAFGVGVFSGAAVYGAYVKVYQGTPVACLTSRAGGEVATFYFSYGATVGSDVGLALYHDLGTGYYIVYVAYTIVSEPNQIIRCVGISLNTLDLESEDIATIPPVDGWTETAIAFSLTVNNYGNPMVVYGVYDSGAA